ncbi:MAG: tetratricopeptide repeat protein [Candidatus Hydrogenedentes bacterium]|nr:tetratricopeptide repeat protein [Candidatus Hydrogenedentota bacterium]
MSYHRLKNSILLVIILIVGTALRIAYLNEVRESPDFYVPLHDAEFKDFWAKGIAFGNWVPPRGQGNPFMDKHPLPNPPGYPIFLAIFYKISDNPKLIVRFVQIGIGIVNILLVYAIATNLFGPLSALFSALLMAIYWAFVYYDLDLNQQTIFICLLLLFFLFTIKGYKTSRLKYFILSGLVFGLSNCFRGETFILALPISFFILISSLLNKDPLRQSIVRSASFFMSFLIPITPIVVYNYNLCGVFALGSHSGECNIYFAFDPSSSEYTSYAPKFLEWLNKTPEDTVEIFDLDGMTLGLSRELGKTERVSYKEWRDYLVHNAIKNAYKYPLQTLVIRPIKRFIYLLLPIEMDENKVLFYEIELSNVLRVLPSFRSVITLFTLGILALISHLLKRNLKFRGYVLIGISLLLFFLILYIGFFSFIIAGSRYRVSLIPTFIIFGSYGISTLLEESKSFRLKEKLLWGMTVLLLYVIFGLQFLPYTPDRSRWLDEKRRCYQLANQTLKGINFFKNWLIHNPEDPDAYYHLGVLYLDAKNYTEAEKHLLQTLKLAPNHKSSPYNLAIIYANKKDWESAIKYIKIATERNPKKSDVWVTHGWIYETLGNSKEAEEAYKKALSISPSDYKALTHLGILLLKNNLLNDAENLLQKAVSINPSYPLAKFNLAQIYIRKRMPRLAIELLSTVYCKYTPKEEALKNLGIAYLQVLDYQNAEKYLSEAYKYSPSDDLTALLAVTYAGNGKVRKSEECIEKLIYKRNSSQNLFNIGTAYELMKQYELAKDYYRRALEKDPQNPDALAGLGNIALIEGDKNVAYQYFAKAYEIKPTQIGAWYNIILKKIEDGKLEESKEELEKFIKNYPEHIEAYYNLALVCEKLNAIEEALKNYDEVLKKAPNHERALFSKSIICINTGDLDNAEQLLSKLIRTLPDDAYYHLGIVRSLKEDWERAHSYYLKSYFTNPSPFYSDSVKAYNLAQSYDKLGCLEDSLFFYSNAIKLNLFYSEALDAYGYVQFRNGNFTEAKTIIENILEKGVPTQWTFYNYALLFDKLGEPQIAIPYAMESEALLGRRKEVLHLLGELYRKIGSYGEAEKNLKLAKQLAPQDYQILKSTAFLKMQQERYLDAETLFQKCLETYPNDTDILESYADLFIKIGNMEKAEEYFRKTCEIKETPSALRKLGLLLADRNKLKESYEMLIKALSYEPNNPIILMRIGDILVAERKDTEAKNFYERALELAEDNYLLHRNYAELLFRNNDYENAKKHFQLALQLNPEDHQSKAGLGLLYAKENNFDEAKNILIPLSKSKTDLFEVNQQLAEIFIQEKDLQNAVKYLKRCIIAQPDRKEFKELLQKITSSKN